MSFGILLSGPPGVGKTSVGRALAARLGVAAIDLDDVVLAKTKKSAAAIIRSEGEAELRAVEAAALEELDPAYRVISLGGGTLTTPRGRKAARARGAVLGLSADTAVVRERAVKSGVDRPLLGASAAALESLLEARRATYAAVDRKIDAGAELDAVVDRVVAGTEKLDLLFADVGGARSRILLGEDLADAAAGAIASLAPTRPVLALLDRGVPQSIRTAYIARVAALHPVHEILLEGGEAVKTWSVLGEVLDEALANGCGRQSAVIAIGGGAVCDLAALAANMLGRGAPVVLVPSTLLAQVDASIGGKCAVNMRAGRNLAGAFHPASDVIVDMNMLASLDEAEYRSGLAELLKTAIMADGPLFQDVVARHPAKIGLSDIARAIRHKAAVVARDPYERGERKLLNLGHTLAHALESASNFAMRHGEAVSIGIAAIARFSVSRSWLAEADARVIIEGLAKVGLPVSAPPELLSRSSAFFAHDKKADGGGIDLVAVHELGKVSTKRVSSNELVDLVRYGGMA